MLDCIVSAVRGRKYEAVQDTLRANKEAYCRACGYRCLVSNNQSLSDRPPAWDKLPALRAALEGGKCRAAAWVDGDVIFRRAIALPFNTLSSPTDVLMMRDQNGLNSGVMMLTAADAAMELLGRAWNATQFLKHNTWEQQALRHVLLTQPLLRRHVQLVQGGLVDSKRDASSTPLFHAAGCFSSRSKTYGVCHTVLRSVLNHATLSGGAKCTPMSNVMTVRVTAKDVRTDGVLG